MSELDSYYSYNVGKIVEEIRSRKSKKVLIQLPDGFKHYSTKLLGRLTKLLDNVEFVVDANPIYGSCILNNHILIDYDLVLHFGHEPYPYTSHVNEKVVFLDFLSTLIPSNRLMNDLIAIIKSLSIRKVAMYSVHQHKGILGDVGRFLRNAGIDVLNNLGNATIMGCWFNDVLNYVNTADGYIVVSSGLFHSLGVGMLCRGLKHVIQLDLYRGEVRLLDDVVVKYLKIRYGKIMNSLDAASWCLINGVEGQFRNGVRERLIDVLTARGLKYLEYQSLIINQETLRNIDNEDIDVYVITACPRIPIDDLQDFEKPVLTPGEAFMILKNINEYLFPW